MLEILSPAGNPECLTAALNTGADAVYLGLKEFSARRNAKNFSTDELYEAARICRLSGVKVYLALNTLIYDDEIEQVRTAVKVGTEAGVNAFIIQDMAMIGVVGTISNRPLHASTQMSINSVCGAKMAKKLGFSRVVLARELSLAEIRDITGSVDIETEVFVHGALCASVSGQCYMSAFFGNPEEETRSANRGSCAQPCRLNVTVGAGSYGQETFTEYTLSLKDLSLIERIQELEAIGVTSVKIEGRMKRPEYVAAAVDACYKARQGISPNLERLEAVFSRSGFTDGYFTGEMRSMRGFRSKENVLSGNQVLKELQGLYKDVFKRRKVDINLNVTAEEVRVKAHCDGVCVNLTFPCAEPSKSRETTETDCRTQLSKLGGTVFEAGEITCDIESSLFLPAARINEIRRNVIFNISERLMNI